MVLRPCRSALLDGPAAQADGGFDRPAAFDDHRLDGIQAGFDDRLDGIQAALDDVLDLLAALFDNGFDRLAAAEDRVFHRVRHRISSYSAPAPGTGSIIIFIESGLGVGCNFDGLDRLFQRKTVRDQLRQIESVAVAVEDQVRHFIQNRERG